MRNAYMTGDAKSSRPMTEQEILSFERRIFDGRKKIGSMSDHEANRGLVNNFSTDKK